MSSPQGDQKNWLVPGMSNLSELNIQLPEGKKLFDLETLTAIRNAWYFGTIVDNAGRIWVRGDKLHTILRTSKKQARSFTGGIERHYKLLFTVEEDGVPKKMQCIFGAEIAKILDEIIQNPSSAKHRKYSQYSWELYTFIRDSPVIGEIVNLYIDHVNNQLLNLKQRRISGFQITIDELTGIPLHLESSRSHFSHIRSKRRYPLLALEIWNGLVVNDDTHDLITKAGVLDENELMKMCNDNGWNTSWYKPYLKQLGS